MKSGVLNTDFNTYLVKFQWKSTNNRFIVQGSGLVDVLKQYDVNGVEYIKEFDPVKGTFKRISRKKLLNAFSWETETYLYLQSHYYFK
jgi:hypothetical protein